MFPFVVQGWKIQHQQTEAHMEWKDGYITDIEYVHGVYRELAPSALNLILLIQSLEPVPLRDGFTYCDLGCGQGESVNLFAACHPEGDFHGVDFNYAHVAGARGLASKAGLKNSTFWEASFADLDRLDLPDFDFVVLHGIYTWVGAENRRRVIDFLRDKLKPGGVVYVSYNSLPGWSPHAPLRQLLSSYADTQSGPLEQRVELALEFVGRLKSAQASLFKTSPATGDFFDYIRTLPINYLAHEFFNRDWTLFYHADVVRDLAAAKLSFAGSANIAENQDMLRFSVEQQQILDGVTDRVLRETVKDFSACPLLRRDLFVKGRPRITAAQQLQHFGNLPLALTVPEAKLERKALFPIGTASLDRELYDPVLLALDQGAQTLEQLLLRPELRHLGMGKVIEAVMVLLSAEYVMPAAQPTDQAVEATARLNSVQLERQAGNLKRDFVASPVLQNAMRLDWLERELLLAEKRGEAKPMAPLWEKMRRRHHKLSRDGEPLETDEENLAELCARIESFRSCELPMLRQLLVV